MRPAQEGSAGQLRSWATRARPVIDCELQCVCRRRRRESRQREEAAVRLQEKEEREQAMTEAAQGERRFDS